MLTIRRSGERGHVNAGWLDSYHTFSFADYYDPKHMGFRSLRVINEDRVDPGKGFPKHPHRDMEILTYVLEGALEHKDSMGNGSVIRPGDVQYMCAGAGITHSEYNASMDDLVHLYQIWILPASRGLEPSYDQKYYPREKKLGNLCLLASNDGRDGSIRLNQDASLYASVFANGAPVHHALSSGRHAWVQVVRGSVRLNGLDLATGDAVAVSDEPSLDFEGSDDAEILLFDLD